MSKRHIVQTLVEELRGSAAGGKEIDAATVAYLKRMDGRRPDAEMVMEVADAVREALDAERETCPGCGEDRPVGWEHCGSSECIEMEKRDARAAAEGK